MRDSRALLIGAPDALAGMTGEELARIAGAARSNGALVAVDVLHPGRPEDLERLAPLLAVTDWFMPNEDQILALTGRTELADAIKDVLALGTGGVAVTWARTAAWSPGRTAARRETARARGRGGGHHRLRRRLHRRPARRAAGGRQRQLDAAWLGLACGALVATGLGSDAGIENLGQVLDFLSGTQPAVAGRIKEHMS